MSDLSKANASSSTTPSGASSSVYPIAMDWNKTERAYPTNVTLQSLFSEQAARTPDAIALTFEGANLTYRELDRRSNKLARFLQRSGVGPNQLVALSCFRSFEMVVGLFGILKAGGAYVPVDPEYPVDRLTFMLEDAGAPVLLTQEKVLATLPPHKGISLCLDSDWKTLESLSDAPLEPSSGPDNLAYMIYTSGSTGRPKGALNGHRGVCNRLLWHQERYQLSPSDTVLQKTPFSFDVSVWEFFWPLIIGARMVLAKPGGHQDPGYLAELIRREKVNVLHFVPSMLRAFLDEPTVAQCTSLRDVICSGEALTYDLQERFFKSLGCQLHNLYGPTEAAVDVTHWTCVRGATSQIVPIGRPVSNTRIHVLDEKLREVPVGESGELHIGGVQVGKGYHNRPDLTAEKFIPDPFSSDPAARLYKTGDLARWLPDGTVDYLGRIDFQVKIRGFRIELGEIESILAQHPDVHQAVVVAKRTPDSDDKLVGYLSSKTGVQPSVSELRSHLLSRVPEYMVPALFVWLKEIPLSPNGKVDRKALPEPSRKRPDLAKPYAAPGTPLEEELASIWAELLGLENVGVDDSFFELGGTSLLAVRLTTIWRKRAKQELPIVKVFQFPTIAGLSKWLTAKDAKPNAAAPQALKAGKRISRSGSAPGQEPVAIVGMACRLPGASDIEAFWKNLCEGVESITTFPREELGVGIDERLRNDPDYVPARGIVEGAECFDATFFGIGQLEASVMDPQQRVFLELAYTALEKSGYDPDRCPGPVGVFAGVGDNHYFTTNLIGHPTLLQRAGKLALEYGNEKDYIALRVAYLLGLTGPAVSANTGCSTSLLAVDHAVRALSLGECDMALAGGVDIFVPQKSGFLYEEGGTFCKDGHCRPFDADATGTMFCDGAGLVVLKRLDDALEAGDTIHAVIRGTAKNNNGSRTASFLAPSVEGQAEVIAMAQANAGVPVETIGYVEAHGTGTPVGDPIEVEALNQVFNAATEKRGFSYIGSLKGNVGHPTIAAGITGLIKAALVLERELIPATLHFKNLNPKIDLADSCFKIADKLIPYPRSDTPRRSAVSSFGFGGTNVHAILEEPPLLKPTGPSRKQQLILLSAKTPAALAAQGELLASALEKADAPSLPDAAFTLSQGRKALPHRRFVVGADAAECAAQLRSPHPMKAAARQCLRRDARVVFLFGGQGTQYVNMGRELYQEEPLFRAVLDECFDLLRPHMEQDLKALMHPPAGEEDAAREALQNTCNTQPAIFAIEYALARWWQSIGVEPVTMAGHSVGEFVAATLAGIFELPDVLRIVATRGRLMQSMEPGSMLSVRAKASDVESLLPPDIQLATINGPSLCVVAGPINSIAAFKVQLEGRGLVARLLHTSHAFHSAMMTPILEPLRKEFESVRLSAPRLRFVSTVTGKPISDEQACDPMYWTRHALVPVRFSDAVQTLLEQRFDLFLECGPRSTLSTLTRQHATAEHPVSAVPSLGESVDTIGEVATLMHAAGSLWLQGASIDWDAFFAHEQRRRVPLPSYPFERQRHWVEPVAATEVTIATAQPVAATETPHVRAEASSAPAAPEPAEREESATDRVMAIVAPITGRKPADIDPVATFLEQGFDSLLLVQIAAAIRNELQVKLSFNQLMTLYPNVTTLVAHLKPLLPAVAPRTPQTLAKAGAKAPTTSQGSTSSSSDPELRAIIEQQSRNISELQVGLQALLRHFSLTQNLPLRANDTKAEPHEANTPDVFPTTFPQQGIHLSSQLSERLSASYNESMALRLRGKIVKDKILTSIHRMSLRHDALRSIVSEDGKSLEIARSIEPEIKSFDFSTLTPLERDQELASVLAKDCEVPFNLREGPLFRATFIALAQDEAVVVLTGHHVICDGWSHDVLVHDFSAYYSEELSGEPFQFAPVKSFGKFLARVAARESGDEFREAREYWERKFEKGFPLLTLPTDRKRSYQRDFASGRASLAVSTELVRDLRAFAANHGSSFFGSVLTAYSLLLARISGLNQFVIALPTAEQPVLAEPFLVGNCVNMIPFLVDLKPNGTVAQALLETNAQLSAAHEHSIYTSVHLLNRLRPRSGNPEARAFSVGITIIQKWKNSELSQKGFSIDFDVNPKRFESFEFYLAVADHGSELSLSCNYEKAIYDKETVQAWLEGLVGIIKAMIQNPTAEWNVLTPKLLHSRSDAPQAFLDIESSQAASQSAPAESGMRPLPSLIVNPEIASGADAVEENLLAIWKKALRSPNASLDDLFFESGGNSLTAAKIKAEVLRILKVDLPMTFFYNETPTPRAAAAWLRKHFPEALVDVSAAEVEVEQPAPKHWLHPKLRKLLRLS